MKELVFQMGTERQRWKFRYLFIHQEYACPIWKERGRYRGCEFAGASDLHHRLHNTKLNRRQFPLFIHSMLNLAAVNHAMHLQHPNWGRPTLLHAERCERVLERWPMAEAFVNGKVEVLGWKL